MKRNTSPLGGPTSDDTPKRVPYTPGPYYYCRDKDGCDETYDIWAENGHKHITAIHFWEEEEQSRANACLLASAPELVEALRSADQWLRQMENSHYQGSKLAHQVQALIERATSGGADDSDQDRSDTAASPPDND